MKNDRPSLTAVFVSLARGIATIDRGAPGEGLDPAARGLLPGPARLVLDAIERASSTSGRAARVARIASLGLVDHLELRSLAIDEVAADAFARETAQLVILGAGLDARAWRLPGVDRVRAFEVDHPSTQRYKKAHAGPEASRVEFVAVDFQHDSLDARLEEAGHDPRATTLWIWEGVTPYLPLDAVRATLDVVSRRSPKGSTLAMTYVTPNLTTQIPPALHGVVRTVFGAIGEPIHGAIERDVLASTLERAGWSLTDDTGIEDWTARFHPKHPPFFRIAERLAVARVR